MQEPTVAPEMPSGRDTDIDMNHVQAMMSALLLNETNEEVQVSVQCQFIMHSCELAVRLATTLSACVVSVAAWWIKLVLEEQPL
jgi:hypothetical protein